MEKPNIVLRIFRKHDQRHKKAFTCSYPNCPKSGQGQGFGTINDLNRHIRSKHQEAEADGRPSQVFSCHFPECQEKVRKFTRPDNYGVHLNRCHGMNKVDIKGIIQRLVQCEQYQVAQLTSGLKEKEPVSA